MARTTKDFKDADLITYAGDGRMMVVRDDTGDRYDVSLIVENVVVYSNTRKGMIKFLSDKTRVIKSGIVPKQYTNLCGMLAYSMVNAD